MGLLDGITGFFERNIGPVVTGMIAGPQAGLQQYAQEGQARTARNKLEGMNNMQGDPIGNIGFTGSPVTQNFGGSNPSGFFSSGGAFRTGVRDFGGFLGDLAPIASMFGVGNDRFQRTNSGTAITLNSMAPNETSSSGEIMGANLGLAGPLLQAGRQFLRSPAGSTALGFGAGALGMAMGGDGSGAPRITRRMKSDVRRIYMMAGMDPNMTAQILNNMGTYPRMQFDASLVFFILTKRFRNDGPVVTKAAVRKTKTTLRRMKGVVDMYNSVCKPTTRRAPMRRAAPKAVQLIKN